MATLARKGLKKWQTCVNKLGKVGWFGDRRLNILQVLVLS